MMMSVQIQERGSVIQVKVLGTLLLIDEGMCELLQTFAGFNKVFVIFFFSMFEQYWIYLPIPRIIMGKIWKESFSIMGCCDPFPNDLKTITEKISI